MLTKVIEYTCIECNAKFTIDKGEEKYYFDKGFSLPKRCKICRDRKKLSNMYDEILENWSVDAKKESSDYFYNVEEVNQIKNGKKTFIIGRKGSGKTSIAQHLCSFHDSKSFAHTLSFKNFPFNILYSLENTREYTSPNQYISIWKYLIYTYICKLMIKNENINLEIRNKLAQLYTDNSSTALNKLIEKWTSKDFGLEIMGCGFNFSREKDHSNTTWFDNLEILEQVILEFCDDSKYFIVFDELDEDYKNFASKTEEIRYKSMITSLFKCIYDIRAKFDNEGLHIYPVAFLRSDIYDQITYSDKNKWYENTINLEWSTEKIQKMLAHRICVAYKCSSKDFENAWKLLFSTNKVPMGYQKRKELSIYSYIERSTEMRPRDFIQYIKECVQIAKVRGIHPITPQIVKDADDEFSEYLKRETIDEIYAVLPEIHEIFGILSTIRKQHFNFEEFNKEYNKLIAQGDIPSGDVKKVLLKLFDSGVIGNVPSIRTKAIFKFSEHSPRFNFNENMIIHRGLFKALQIY